MAYQEYYEQRATVDEYLAFHFPAQNPLAGLLGASAPPLEELFPFAVKHLWKGGCRALDVGAAVGRVSFDLARDHEEAWGLDRSRALVHAARRVQQKCCARYRTQVEGDLYEEHDVKVEAPSNARFVVGDALALPFTDACFDTVVALNLIDRVPDPKRALGELGRVVGEGGTLVIASPYTWLEGYTPKERWLGGFLRNRAPVRGIEAVREQLAPGFTLMDEQRMPFFIPHHERSGQLGVALVQTFSRRA